MGSDFILTDDQGDGIEYQLENLLYQEFKSKSKTEKSEAESKPSSSETTTASTTTAATTTTATTTTASATVSYSTQPVQPPSASPPPTYSPSELKDISETIKRIGGTYSADWGSGSGGFQSMYDSLLTIRFFLLKRITTLLMQVRIVSSPTEDPHSFTQHSLYPDVLRSWRLLHTDTKKQAEPGGDESDITIMDPDDPSKWPHHTICPVIVPSTTSLRKRKRADQTDEKVNIGKSSSTTTTTSTTTHNTHLSNQLLQDMIMV